MANGCVLVCTWSGGVEWLKNLMPSLKGAKYPVVIVVNGYYDTSLEVRKYLLSLNDLNAPILVVVSPDDGYEMGAIKAALEYTNFDEFFLIQDTCRFKNLDILDTLFIQYEDRSIQWGYRFQSYLGKYLRRILDTMELPTVTSKHESLVNEEKFTDAYKVADPNTLELFPGWSDQIGREEEFLGRKNLIIENDYLIKWKGYWV